MVPRNGHVEGVNMVRYCPEIFWWEWRKVVRGQWVANHNSRPRAS